MTTPTKAKKEKIELELLEAESERQTAIFANNFRCAHIDNTVALRADSIDLFDWNKNIAQGKSNIQINASTTISMTLEGFLKLKTSVDQLYNQLKNQSQSAAPKPVRKVVKVPA